MSVKSERRKRQEGLSVDVKVSSEGRSHIAARNIADIKEYLSQPRGVNELISWLKQRVVDITNEENAKKKKGGKI